MNPLLLSHSYLHILSHHDTQNHIVNSSFGSTLDAPNPKSYLKKGTRSTQIPLVERHPVNRNKESYKPPVPSRSDKPVLGRRTDKNYITCNAVEVIQSTPKQVQGEEIRLHEEYGKIPSYLSSVKAAMEKERQLVEKYVAEQYGPSSQDEETQLMNDSERLELIDRLKQRWDDVNFVYQKYCHKVQLDTPGEIKRKATQEAELKQLEEDIEKLSRPGPLVIKM